MGKKIDQMFRETTERICGVRRFSEVLNQCKEQIQAEIPVNLLCAGLLDSTVSGVRIVACVRDGDAFPVYDSWVIPLSQETLENAEAQFSDAACILADGNDSPACRLGARVLGVEEPFSALLIKLPVKDGKTGFLGVIAWGNDQYREEHAAVLTALAPVVAQRLAQEIRNQEMQRLIVQAREDIRHLQKDIRKLTGEYLVGAGAGLVGLMGKVKALAGQDGPILLSGEPGTGKGVVANVIQGQSGRSQGPFIRVPCNAVPGGLLFDELFGHEPGAFSGAYQKKRGCCERADGGFLFLEEIGALPLDAQKKLADMLAGKTVVRLGGVKPVAVDVRLIASTSRDLAKQVQDGVFLAELWHRLRAGLIEVPPLRAHKLDIPLLVNHFIHEQSIELDLPVIPALADGEMEKLLEYDWPGNVRELKNTVEKALLFSRGKLLRFPDPGGEQSAGASGRRTGRTAKIPTLDEVMVAHIRRILEKTDGRIEGKGGAADLLGIHYNTLRARMKKLGISFGRDA